MNPPDLLYALCDPLRVALRTALVARGLGGAGVEAVVELLDAGA